MANGILHPSLDADGKQRVVARPQSIGLRTWFTSFGDDPAPTPPASGRGEGAQLRCNMTGGGDTVVADIQFGEPVELHDGEAHWEPSEFGFDDRFSVGALLPATEPVENVAGGGNCNLVPIGGGLNLIVPAAGNGGYDVDLGAAVPVPSGNETGFWDVDQATGAVTPSATPGAARYNLVDFQILNWFIRNVHMGSPRGLFEIDTYDVEWFSPRWKLRMSCTKGSAGAGVMGGWVQTFRANTV